jgi:hemerythrin
MEQCNYSGYEEQVKEHDLLAKRLAEISSGINSGETGPDDVMGFMRNWLLDHILGKDILLGDFLRQHPELTSH